MPPTPLPPGPRGPEVEFSRGAAPISAPAFSFSFATPAKKPRPISVCSTAIAAASPRGVGPKSISNAQSQTSRPDIQTDTRLELQDAVSSRLPRSIARNDGPLRVASAALQQPDLVTRHLIQTTKRFTAFVPLDQLSTPTYSPNLPPAASERGKRKLNDVLDQSSPFGPRLGPSAAALEDFGDPTEGRTVDGRAVLGMSEMPSVISLPKAAREGKEKEEGIGVSPRRTKGILKWNGRGQAPLSLQLSGLLSAQHSSLLLFYTSLDRTLHPVNRNQAPTRRRSVPPRPGVSLPPQPVLTFPNVVLAIVHLRTAPVVLRLGRSVNGHTHTASLFHAHVIRWSPTSRAQSNMDGVSRPLGQDAASEHILLSLQPVPSDCPRVGCDPRMGERCTQLMEVGVWEPYTLFELPPIPRHADNAVPTVQGAVTDANAKRTQPYPNRVLFATRYLIAVDTTR